MKKTELFEVGGDSYRKFLRDFSADDDSDWVRHCIVAHSMIDHVFGRDWCVHSGMPRLYWKAAEDQHSMVRLVRLAECVYHLCECVGFEAKIKELRSKESIELCEGELWGASMIASLGVRIEFVDPTAFANAGETSADLIINGGVAHCELKAKSLDAKFSYETILKTLKRGASKKAPGPKLVCLRIPSSWTTEPLFELNLETAFSRAAKDYSSVALFVAHWEALSAGGSYVGFSNHVNASCRFQSADLSHLLARLTARPCHTDWPTFDDLCIAMSRTTGEPRGNLTPPPP